MSGRTPRCIFVTAVALAVMTTWPAAAGANVPLTRVSADPFSNPTSQHATELEPDTFAYGSTVVAAFQVGRFFNGGATDIGVVRSGDGGQTWDAPDFLPGMTFSSGADSPFERVSDASVAYDAAHGVWLISSIPIMANGAVPVVYVNRSIDDGRTWSGPIALPAPQNKKVDLDKNWTVCDNWALSPHRGTCCTEYDDFGSGGIIRMSRSTDGGRTWSPGVAAGGPAKGLGGQPVVQPNGNVIVPFDAYDGKIESIMSTDGGTSWTKAIEVAPIRAHQVAGGLRTRSMPSAEIDGAGRVYVVWQDCRFRVKCAANDIVLSRSADGVNWTKPARIPIDPVASGVDHFIPGLAVDPNSSGRTAHLALTYYFYPDATCAAGCQLKVGYVSSPDGGAHWGDATTLAGPFPLDEVANTSQGRMVGDYISTSFSG
ncbi:MAG: hypothetical protein QOH57_1669, partial [Mycobacterium sp.]|nr:hypothetical protein [Mycobacterium sp.]